MLVPSNRKRPLFLHHVWWLTDCGKKGLRREANDPGRATEGTARVFSRRCFD